jgi:hypothetical protein
MEIGFFKTGNWKAMLPRHISQSYNHGTMVDRLPMVSDVHFEQTPERLKIVLPVRRNWPMLLLYSGLVLMWAVMLIWGIIFLGQIILSGESYRFVFAVMILLLLLILFRFGRYLSRQWADYLSNREVVFINQEELIVRRPVSIWGNTNVYDMEHVLPFYESDQPVALAFDYGYRHVYIGEALTAEARQALRRFLNQTYFPAHHEEQRENP